LYRHFIPRTDAGSPEHVEGAKKEAKLKSDRINRINRIFFAFPEERQKGASFFVQAFIENPDGLIRTNGVFSADGDFLAVFSLKAGLPICQFHQETEKIKKIHIILRSCLISLFNQSTN